jgi:hypothetical protein
MELKFEEVNNLGNQNNLNYEAMNSTGQIKYWEQPKIERKKKVTFDDILNNMNLVVTQDGVLQHMRPISQEQNQYNQSYEIQPQYQQQPSFKNEQIDPSVKHSYIYNKYFKGYSDENLQPIGPRRPKSIEELKQMLREDKIKEIQQKIRLSQIKSKKMLFTNINGIHPTKNNLRVMSFK